MYMEKPRFDPGLTETYTGPVWRAINKDGTFNVRRSGATLHDFHPYLKLISMGWPLFILVLFAAYVFATMAFAAGYYAFGEGALQGVNVASVGGRFIAACLFSAETLTTVGYGNIYPVGLGPSTLSAIEAWTGVLALAVAAGLLYGRVSRPSARFGFSRKAIIAPYQNGHSLQFRVLNRRANSLMELEASVMLMTVEDAGGELKRRYQVLRLERREVIFLPLTWTVVHPIDERSPIWGKTAGDLARLQAEFLILMKAYDDTFSQTVLGRYSYRHDEIEWNVRFAPAFSVDRHGYMVLELQKLDELAE